MKDGKRINTIESVIRIDAVRREDKGSYQCFVRNDQDSAQSTSELKLGGRCMYFWHFLFILIFRVSKELMININDEY